DCGGRDRRVRRIRSRASLGGRLRPRGRRPGARHHGVAPAGPIRLPVARLGRRPGAAGPELADEGGRTGQGRVPGRGHPPPADPRPRGRRTGGLVHAGRPDGGRQQGARRVHRDDGGVGGVEAGAPRPLPGDDRALTGPARPRLQERAAVKSDRSSSQDTPRPATRPQNAEPMLNSCTSETVTTNVISAPRVNRPENAVTKELCSTRSIAKPPSTVMNASGAPSINPVNRGANSPKTTASAPQQMPAT